MCVTVHDVPNVVRRLYVTVGLRTCTLNNSTKSVDMSAGSTQTRTTPRRERRARRNFLGNFEKRLRRGTQKTIRDRADTTRNHHQ